MATVSSPRLGPPGTNRTSAASGPMSLSPSSSPQRNHSVSPQEEPAVADNFAEEEQSEQHRKEEEQREQESDAGDEPAAPAQRRRSMHSVNADAFNQFLHVLGTDFDLVRTLSTRVGFDQMEAFVKVNTLLFAGRGTLLGLTAHAVRWELRDVNIMSSTPFSSGTFPTRFLSSVSFAYGRTYLKEMLSPVIEAMLECPGLSYEVNPSCIAPSDNMGENRSALRSLVNRFITRIVGSAANVPQPLLVLWHIVAVETSKRYPDAAQDVLSQLIFGRFWAPAIACPHAYGICNADIPRNVARGLILVSKVLRAMPGGKPFREEYMQCMDAFARNGANRLADYTSAACVAPTGIPRADMHALPTVQGPLRPWMRMMNAANPIDPEPIVQKMTPSDVGHFYVVMHKAQDEVAERAGEQGDTVREAFDTLGDPVEQISLPVDVASSVLRDLAQAPADSNMDCAPTVKTYPGTDVELATFAHASWDVMDREYNPPLYTDTSVPGGDPDIFVENAVLMFNDIDRKGHVDRRSAEGNYKVVSGAPRNPVQRTGIRGRGKLMYWGPNHHGSPVITRWSRKADGSVRHRLGRPVLEVLCNTDTYHTLSLLESPLRPDATLPDWVADFFCVSNAVSIQKTTMDENRDSALIQFGAASRASALIMDRNELPEDGGPVLTARVSERGPDARAPPVPPRDATASPNGTAVDTSLAPLFTSGSLVYDGYVNDPLNTDNAWLESTSWHFHDEEDALAEYSSAIEAYDELQWHVVDDDANWNAHARELLAMVAERLNAHFRDRLLPVLCDTVVLIENMGLEHTGIYRLSGSKKSVAALVEAVYTSSTLPTAELNSVQDVNELTGLVKTLLRDMTPPLIPYELYHDAVALATADADRQVDLVSELLIKLPTSNFKIVMFLVNHLQQVAQRALENRMGISNLAVVFGPTIMRSPKGLGDDMRDQGSQCKVASVLMGMPPEFFDNLAMLRTPNTTLSLNYDLEPQDGEGATVNMMSMLPTAAPVAMPPGMASLPLGKHGVTVGAPVSSAVVPSVADVAADVAANMSDAAAEALSAPSIVSETSTRRDSGVETMGGASSVATADPPVVAHDDEEEGHQHCDEAHGRVADTAMDPYGTDDDNDDIEAADDEEIYVEPSDSLNPDEDAAAMPYDDDADEYSDPSRKDSDPHTEGDSDGEAARRRSSSIYANVVSRAGGALALVTSPAAFECENNRAENAQRKVSQAGEMMRDTAGQSPEGYVEDALQLLDAVTASIEEQEQGEVHCVAIDADHGMKSDVNDSAQTLTLSPDDATAVHECTDDVAAGVNDTTVAAIPIEDEVGDCADCWASQVVGKYDEETESFYCTRCWSTWAAEATAVETAPTEWDDDNGSAAEFDPTRSPGSAILQQHGIVFVEENRDAASPTSPQVLDEDGLPLSPRRNPHRAAASPTVVYDEDGLPLDADVTGVPLARPSLFFDDDGLPCEINVDEYEFDSPGRRPSQGRRWTNNPSLADELPAEDMCELVHRRRTNSRKPSDNMSQSARAMETCREGVLWREIGTSWKKRYVSLQDSMLKIHKTAKASSKVTEYFNITASSNVGFASGNKSFLLSFPDRGYTLRLKANKSVEATEWVRVLSNACRIAAHSLA
eukprot:m.12946 g.12946  ORF g.12946 m.12946 type:complete len:1623 (+) comp2994_c0_seq1:35-4903(+)